MLTTKLTIDLVPNFTFSNTTFLPGEIKDVVININEVAGGTTYQQIEFFIPNSVGFSYGFDPDMTSVNLAGGVTVNNPDWFVTATATGFLFQSDVPIVANGTSRIALSVLAIEPDASANLTVNIAPNSGGESNFYNNIIELTQSVLK